MRRKKFSGTDGTPKHMKTETAMAHVNSNNYTCIVDTGYFQHPSPPLSTEMARGEREETPRNPG